MRMGYRVSQSYRLILYAHFGQALFTTDSNGGYAPWHTLQSKASACAWVHGLFLTVGEVAGSGTRVRRDYFPIRNHEATDAHLGHSPSPQRAGAQRVISNRA